MVKHYKTAIGEEVIVREIEEDDGSITWFMPLRMILTPKGITGVPYILGDVSYGFKIKNANPGVMVGEINPSPFELEKEHLRFEKEMKDADAAIKAHKAGLIVPGKGGIFRP